MRRKILASLFACCLAGSAGIASGPFADSAGPEFGPYFLGHETEPAMDYGGRVMISLHTAVCDAGSLLTRRMPWLAPAYELPLAVLVSTLQHEIHGHGARGREYNLKPSYGFGLDFSAYTTIDRYPRTMEELAALAAGGTEADTVMARRIAIGFCRPGSVPASAAPLFMLAKLDLSVYTAFTSTPRAKPERTSPGEGQASADDDGTSFIEEYEQGNDIAIYLTTRQATRRQADPADVWLREYKPDFDDPDLDKTWRQTREVALWNALDPMLWASMFLYVRDHAMRGERYLPAPAVPLGDGYGLTVGTRGSIEPQSVSRFLDVFVLTPFAVFGVYGRDLRSADDTAFGYGAGAYRMALSPHAHASLWGDVWDVPTAEENLYRGSGWNVAGEIEFSVGPDFGLSLKAGYKNAGYFPGVPTADGLYVGGGLTAAF